jgi:hypothetical protein
MIGHFLHAPSIAGERDKRVIDPNPQRDKPNEKRDKIGEQRDKKRQQPSIGCWRIF